MAQWFQRLRANAKYGAVNDATIQGYLRAASQLENVWQQIDDKVDEHILQGLPPWEAYTRMGYALAFVRACRMNVVFVQELLKADTANAGYLPKVTYDQALALCEHIEPTIEEAIKAATNSRYVLPPSTLPLKLGPHIGGEYQSLPLSHLQGTIYAAQEIKDWTAGLLAKYELALHAAKLPLPQEVSTHLEQMKSELELGDFHLRTGVDMVGQISQGRVAEALHQKAEGFLWEAMESFYKVSQLLAMPNLRPHPARQITPAQKSAQKQPGASPVQARPAQKLPEPPEPVAIDLLNQVIAEPGPAAKAPAQASPEMLNMLNQLTTSAQDHQPELSRPVPETPGLLNQRASAAQHTQPRTPDASPQLPPETPGLLDQRISTPEVKQRTSSDTAPDLTSLFAQGHGTAPRPQAPGEQSTRREAREHKAAPKDNTLDLLAEISREREQPDS
jgi:hypothetical protein